MTMAAHFKNLVGTQWGWLTIIRHIGFNARRQSLWIARCRCDREITVRGTDLTTLVSPKRSCGGCRTDYRLSGIFTTIGPHGVTDSKLLK
jgi:hypothetical protein